MVLATKRAVGSEYDYPIYHDSAVPKQKGKVRAKKRPSPMVGITIISLLFVIGISYTFLQAAKAHLIWQVSQTKQVNAAMQMDIEKIKLDVAKLKSLDRIEIIATSQLQMVKNPGIEYLAFQGDVTGGKNAEVSALATTDKSQTSTAHANSVPQDNLIERLATAISKGKLDKG